MFPDKTKLVVKTDNTQNYKYIFIDLNLQKADDTFESQ